MRKPCFMKCISDFHMCFGISEMLESCIFLHCTSLPAGENINNLLLQAFRFFQPCIGQGNIRTAAWRKIVNLNYSTAVFGNNAIIRTGNTPCLQILKHKLQLTALQRKISALLFLRCKKHGIPFWHYALHNLFFRYPHKA